MLWESLRGLENGNIELLNQIEATNRQLHINGLLRLALAIDINTRPSVKQIETYAAANVLRSRLEENGVLQLIHIFI